MRGSALLRTHRVSPHFARLLPISLLITFAFSVNALWALDYLEIHPPFPQSNDFVSADIAVTFELYNYSLQSSELRHDSQSLTWDLVWLRPAIGLQAFRQYTHSEPLGRLAPGDYELSANVYNRIISGEEDETLLVDQGTIRFHVTPEPGSAVMLLALATVIASFRSTSWKRASGASTKGPAQFR